MMENIKYIYVFTLEFGWRVPKLTVEKVKVKETQKQYRCLENGKSPFRYSRQVNKSEVGNEAFKSYTDIYYYSLDSNIEIFKNKISELLQSKIDKCNTEILKLQNIQEIANQIIK